MCKSFMDMEDGDICFSTSNNMAMDSEGHMMMLRARLLTKLQEQSDLDIRVALR